MNSSSQYSSVAILRDKALKHAEILFEATALSQLWPLAEVQDDQAFKRQQFPKYLSLHDIRFRAASLERPHKNITGTKH